MGLFGTIIKNGPAIIKVIEAVGDILDDGKRNKSYHYERDDDNYDDYRRNLTMCARAHIQASTYQMLNKC